MNVTRRQALRGKEYREGERGQFQPWCHQWHCIGLRMNTSQEWSSRRLYSRTNFVHNVQKWHRRQTEKPYKKFTDDKKIGNSIIDDRVMLASRKTWEEISEWCEKWEMPFNVNKCYILPVGTGNQNKVWDEHIKIENVQCAKDLGVTIAFNLKFFQAMQKYSG